MFGALGMRNSALVDPLAAFDLVEAQHGLEPLRVDNAPLRQVLDLRIEIKRDPRSASERGLVLEIDPDGVGLVRNSRNGDVAAEVDALAQQEFQRRLLR